MTQQRLSAAVLNDPEKRPTRKELGDDFKEWLLEAEGPQSWIWLFERFMSRYGKLYVGMRKTAIHGMVSRALVLAQTEGKVRIIAGPLYEAVK